MRPELRAEIDRLFTVLRDNGHKPKPAPPARPDHIARVERETEIHFDDDVRDFLLFSNGSGGQTWGAVFSDAPTPLDFASLGDARSMWALFDYDDEHYKEWSDPEAERDPRIRPAFLHHKLWFPLAEFNGYSTAVYYDADPAPAGRHGQIIVYQHDPDAIYYVADTFVEFLRLSTDLLRDNADEIFYPDLDAIVKHHAAGLTAEQIGAKVMMRVEEVETNLARARRQARITD